MTQTHDSSIAPGSSTLGVQIPQVTARAKVLGRALYAGDLKVAGMLHGKVLRSPYAHARIVSIDTTAARALPGVKAVLTGEDAPAQLWGVHHKERAVLAKGVVRFCGEEVAAVAAVSEEIARDALDLIQVEYEELPAILSVEEAMDEEAPPVHPGRANNIGHEIEFARGDVDAGFAAAHLIHEATYTTHSQYPGYMEPMATVAAPDPDGRLVLWTSTQAVNLVRMQVAATLGLPVSRVRVVQATTGGGFGGKIVEDDNQLVAGLLALKTMRPVRLVNSRLEDFQACCASVPERITLKLGMDRDGLIVAKEVRIVAECGAYAGLAGDVMHVSAMRSDNMHRNPNVRSHATLYYTNNPPRGAFRGFGGTQMQFALNSHIHTMAGQLGLDPVLVHERNALKAGEVSVHGWQIGSTGLVECLQQATEAIGWAEKRLRPKDTGVKRRGVGMAAAMHVSGNRTIGNWDGSTVIVKINEDGRVFIISGECDMGQGASTMISQIVAHELALPLAHVFVVPPDTDVAPVAVGTLASRVTMSAGNAAIVAGRKAREALFALAAPRWGVAPEALSIGGGAVFVTAQPEQRATLAELARQSVWRHDGGGIQVEGRWDPKTVMHDDALFGNIAAAYSYAAQAVEVEVDTETGRVTVLDSYVADDCGKALNPIAIHGQTNGATVQAFGWALYEQLHYDESGRLANGNFADYTMATADAVPMLRGGFVESMDPNGPYGAKGASETAILPGAPAIANAVEDAVGIRIRDLPITPEKVLAALRARKQEEARDA